MKHIHNKTFKRLLWLTAMAASGLPNFAFVLVQCVSSESAMQQCEKRSRQARIEPIWPDIGKQRPEELVPLVRLWSKLQALVILYSTLVLVRPERSVVYLTLILSIYLLQVIFIFNQLCNYPRYQQHFATTSS